MAVEQRGKLAQSKEAISSQKFIGEHSLCFALRSGPPKHLSTPLALQSWLMAQQ